METPTFSPREFLRARRPEEFSDTVSLDVPVLDRSLLEYHLETLTSRSQDKDFEQFARRLAERAVCPNLLPQTGPTGGGDSHVDAETYPVADTLALAWYEGIAQEAASERWAFAFSAKKEWRSKLKSDVEKIAKTQRGYTKALFVTNQYVRDKLRAQIEDELRKKLKLDVRVFDRSWILDRVFSLHLEELAIDALRISVPKRPEVRKGPRDSAREQELEELENSISTALQEGRLGPGVVEECLDAATLARSLERPRVEVEGLITRAERMATRAGTDHQRLRSAYLWAWTAYFWFEDYRLFLEWYRVAEERGKASRNSHDLELLHNLWNLLYSGVRAGTLTKEEAAVRGHANVLSAALKRVSKEEGRPSATLHARTLLLQMRLISSLPEEVDRVLLELGKVVRESEGLVGYPLEPLVELLTELGGFLDGQPEYENLFATIVEVTSRREGDLKAARMLLKRGTQQFEAKRFYEAIRSIGLSLRRLQAHESRDEFVQALYMCGAAYEEAGLLWAARGSTLYAASVAANDFWTYSAINPLQALCYRKLKWLELRLGRIPHVLAWHELDRAVRMNLESRAETAKTSLSYEQQFDLILGILILKADIWQLKAMAQLPDVLQSLGLHFSTIALFYALGYEEKLPEEFIGIIPEGETLRDLAIRWRSQPAAEDIPPSPLLGDGRTVTLNSRVLGCRIELDSENVAGCVALSESLLAAIESLFSTAVHDRVVPREPVLKIHVRQAQFAEKPFGFEVQDRVGRPHVEIRCASFNPHTVSNETLTSIAQKTFELLIAIFARVFFVRDPERTIARFREELAPERALRFTTSLVTLGNVLGHEPRTSLSAWVEFRPGLPAYPVRRSEDWDAPERYAQPEKPRQIKSDEASSRRAEGTWDPERIRHDEIQMVSLIRESLWNKAGWTGAVYRWYPEDSDPPTLGLLFRNASPATQIFSEWRKELGPRDTDEQLRVTIIRGIDRSNPHAYRIIIGADRPHVGGATQPWITMSRIHRMDAETDANLNGFLRSYEAAGEYILVPVVQLDGAFASPREASLVKRELHVREAWRSGRTTWTEWGLILRTYRLYRTASRTHLCLTCCGCSALRNRR